ncbi:MAG: hypothetical protein HYZ81_00220 [Nitrospinae bacterium]|nr:hypothetical protein [Nitrospinota bacterium]
MLFRPFPEFHETRKVESPLQMTRQIATFRRFALGDFRTILLELSKDPAMLFWEDRRSPQQ